MRKLFCFIFVAITMTMGFISCSKKEKLQKWEYKTFITWGIDLGKFSALYIPIPQEEMDSLGSQGWELVDVYTRVGTVHPNYGSEEYVTGLQPNVRTTGVFYVFKRLKQEIDDNSKTSNSQATVEESRDPIASDTVSI